MKKGYLFISNGNKPKVEDRNRKDPIKISNFSRPCILAALDRGYEIYFGTARYNPEDLECDLPVHLFEHHIYRSVFNIRDNLVAYKSVKNVVNNTGNIEVIHCNTPVGGMVGRLVGRRCHVKKVIYTAHGFHFYKGAPLFNRTVLKWAEQIMAHWTDVIITMNEEDYQAAKKFKLKNGGKIYKVHGVGITLKEFKNIAVDCNRKRLELGFCEDDIVCISAGDLVERKNYRVAIEAIATANIHNLHYIICGVGPEKEALEKMAIEKGISDKVHFLGFRTDVKELMKISDIFLFTTKQEGMPRSMMEAMACGLPCLASKIRGNIDLLDEGKGGFLCEPFDVKGFAAKLKKMAMDSTLRKHMSSYNLESIKAYDVNVVKKEIATIYEEVLG